ncbi:MAG: ribonuclease Y, partial [Ignavibacteriaceae bacterium]|nr:ribonuclease Y [Ignavibacteriaceae bacterium]
SFEGVAKTYAIQAGREIRVVVEQDKIDDIVAEKLAHDIAAKIENEMEYPGQVKVTVIREVRKIGYAK